MKTQTSLQWRAAVKRWVACPIVCASLRQQQYTDIGSVHAVLRPTRNQRTG